MKPVVVILALLPILLFGALACGGSAPEAATVAAPTQAAEEQSTASPQSTTGAVAQDTPEPTAAPTATIAATEPPASAPTEEATPAPPTATATPADTPAPAPTDTPEPTPATGGPGLDSYIIGEGSEITFTIEEELRGSPVRFDAVVSSTGLTGFANLDGSTSEIMLDLHSLQSDQNYRDRYIRDRMFPNTLTAVVTIERLPDLPQSFFDGEETEGTLEGSLQIGDTITPLTFDVVARLDPGVVNVLGKTTFTWDELGLATPVAGPVVYLAEEVRVQVLIVAREQ